MSNSLTNSLTIPSKSLTQPLSKEQLYAFQTIQDFITELKDCIGSKCKSLVLYQRLITKLTFQDQDRPYIERHLNVFKTFCTQNRTEIKSQQTEFTSPNIQFSDKIYINMNYIFRNTDPTLHPTIWKYILLISAILDPENNTKEILQNSSTEANFIEGLISNLTSQIDENTAQNPNALLQNLMNPATLGSIMNSFQNGNLDMNNLLGVLQGMLKNIQQEVENSDDPTVKQMFTMLETTMKGFNK